MNTEVNVISINQYRLANSHRAWLIWGLAAAYFFADYIARVSPGVMTYHLQLAFGVTAAGLGGLSAFFYYPYVAMQVPVGLLVDRFSIRRLICLMAILTAFGCIIFGSATSFATAAFGRVLIGFSAAFAFVSALRLAAAWFPPQKFGLLAGLTQALGMLGAAMGEYPVSFLVSTVGWRYSMYVMAVLFVILAILIYLFVRDAPVISDNIAKKIPKVSIKESLSIILRNRQSWVNAVYVGLLFAPTAVIGEFWGPAYLEYGKGIEHHAAAFADGLIFIGWGFGGPLGGWISDHMGLRKPIMLASAVCGLVLLSILIFSPKLSLLWLYILMFVYGLTNTGVSISYAVAAELSPKNVVGTAMAFTNMASVIVGAVLLQLIGKFMDWLAVGGVGVTDITKLTMTDFNEVLWLLPVCSLISVIMVMFLKETYCGSREHHLPLQS